MTASKRHPLRVPESFLVLSGNSPNRFPSIRPRGSRHRARGAAEPSEGDAQERAVRVPLECLDAVRAAAEPDHGSFKLQLDGLGNVLLREAVRADDDIADRVQEAIWVLLEDFNAS